MTLPHRRRGDNGGSITNADLYDAIQRLETRVGKLEARVSYLFGGCAAAVLVIEIVSHRPV